MSAGSRQAVAKSGLSSWTRLFVHRCESKRYHRSVRASGCLGKGVVRLLAQQLKQITARAERQQHGIIACATG